MTGRPERPLDPDGGPLTEFAQALRELRQAAGNPSYREMARRVHRSPTALSEAAGGAQAPTWDTVEAYVTACDADPGEWRSRWAQIRGDATPLAGTADAEDSVESADAHPTPPEASGSARRTKPLLIAAVVSVAIIAVIAVAAYLAWPVSKASSTAPTPSGMTVAVHDGADPKDSGCSLDPDVVTLDSAEVDLNGKPAGLDMLRYSPKCGVAWARFEPFPKAEIPTGAAVHTDTLRPADNLRTPFQSPYAGAPVYGNVLVSVSNCVLAAAWIELKGQHVLESRTHCFRGKTPVT